MNKQQESDKLTLELVSMAESFIEYRNKLKTEFRLGKLLYDVPTHFKWLDETELLIYWMDVGRFS